MAAESPEVVRNTDTGRFELADAPDRAYLEFRQDAETLTLVHTEVDDELEGGGIGSALVHGALDHAEAADLRIVPECRFVAGWLERHPERADELDIVSP